MAAAFITLKVPIPITVDALVGGHAERCNLGRLGEKVWGKQRKYKGRHVNNATIVKLLQGRERSLFGAH